MSRRVELVLLRSGSASIPLHLERIISSYLGPPPNMTLSETCSFGSIALLDWMWEASCTHASERTPWWSLTNFLRSEPHYYRYQFAESMKVSATRGDSAVVVWLLEHFRGCVVLGEAVEGAASNGHLGVLNLLWNYADEQDEQQNGNKLKVTTCTGGTASRSSPGKNAVCWRDATVVAVRNADGVQWLQQHVPPKTEAGLKEAIQAALDKDDWELGKSLLPRGKCLLDYADYCSPPRMIEWLLDCGYLQRDSTFAGRAIAHLALNGENLSLMRRIAALHCPPPLDWDEDWREAIKDASMSGVLEAFQWMVGHPTGVRVCEKMRQDEDRRDIGAYLGESVLDVGMLECIYEHGLLVADNALEIFMEGIGAAQSFEALKWLLDHVPCSERLLYRHAMDEVAEGGHLKVLQYLQKLQLSFFMSDTWCRNSDLSQWCTTKAMDKAAANGHLDVVKWLHASRPEGCTDAAMNGAAANGHLETVKWLHANTNAGCTTAAVDRAASGGFLDVIKWLYTNTSAGCTCFAMNNAACGGHLETLKWLHDNSSAGCTVEAINGALRPQRRNGALRKHRYDALRSRHFRVASWLHEHFPQYVPAKLEEWIRAKNSFEELLFRQEHYGGIFTADYLQGLKDPSRVGFLYEKGEVWNWVKEKYGGT